MIYRLSTIEVDPSNFSLRADGKNISVEPLVFDLVVYLIENRDRVLTRQELFDNIWPGKIVSDSSLSNHITSARQALGDDGRQQRIIKTIHGRGYRFIADVEEVAGGNNTECGVTTDDMRTERQTRRPSRSRLVVYAVFLILLAAAGTLVIFQEPDMAVESVAVLPLKNLSNDPDQQYFVEGMQDALIARLSRITDLRVISRTSTVRYGATDKSIPDIARELNVDALVEGSVLRDGNRVRITAQLVLGRADQHLWAESYDRDLDQVLLLINEISMAIADEIEMAVKPEGQDIRSQIETIDAEVLGFALKGRHSFEKFRFDESLRHYQQAVKLDPEFAYAHAGVAGSYFAMKFSDRAPDPHLIPKAREAALRALALDGNSAEAYSVLGSIQLYFDWDWDSAQRNLRRAMELRPNSGPNRHAYADYLMVMGDLEGSLNQVEIALLYDPHSPMARGVVEFHRLLVRQYDTVIDNCREALAEWPDSWFIYARYRDALWFRGQQQESLAVYKKTWGKDEQLLRAMEKGHTESGYAGAVFSLAEALAERVPGFNDYVTLAAQYSRAGDSNLAMTWLEQAYEHRQPQILHIKARPVFDELHSDPAFQDLLRRIGFPE